MKVMVTQAKIACLCSVRFLDCAWLDLEHFWCAGMCSAYLGHFLVSRLSGQVEGHRSKKACPCIVHVSMSSASVSSDLMALYKCCYYYYYYYCVRTWSAYCWKASRCYVKCQVKVGVTVGRSHRSHWFLNTSAAVVLKGRCTAVDGSHEACKNSLVSACW